MDIDLTNLYLLSEVGNIVAYLSDLWYDPICGMTQIICLSEIAVC